MSIVHAKMQENITNVQEVIKMIENPKQIFHPYRCEICPKTAEQCVWKYNAKRGEGHSFV